MKNNNILLVDDEPDITLGFSIALEDAGFLVDAFNDPLLALQSFKQFMKEKDSSHYALVLIDIKMPKMNGFELYREIRKVNDKVKVCFATAFDIQKEDEDVKTLAALHEQPIIIRKPISIEDLVNRVKLEIGDS
jgi:two-component system, OmpR family, response regulator ChvI